jgi:hypothetical protein
MQERIYVCTGVWVKTLKEEETKKRESVMENEGKWAG